MRKSWWLTGLMLVTSACLAGCGSSEDTPDASTTPVTPQPSDLIHNEVLEKLGVDTNPPPLTGPDGNPLKEDYNPLIRKKRPLQPLFEIYMAGVAAPTGQLQMLRGDFTEGYANIDLNTGDDTWAKYPKVSTHGDFDGDGYEEVALLVLNHDPASADYKKLFLRVIQDKAEAYAATEKLIATVTDADMSQLDGTLGGYYLMLDIGAGDIDGDSKDEIFGTCASGLWVLDDADAEDSYGVILSKTFTPDAGVTQFLRVGGGDTDGDGKAEMVVVDGRMVTASKTGAVQYHIYDGLDEARTGELKVEDASCELMTADVAVGDVDGDRLAEIVFSGRQSGVPTQHKVVVMEDGLEGYAFLKDCYVYSPKYSQDPSFVPLHRVETGDFDGDGMAEIVSYDQVLDDVQPPKRLQKVATLPYDVGWATVMSVGDVTNDHKDDIVFLRGTDPNSLVVVFGTDAQNTYVRHQDIDIPNNPPYMTLTTVNTDDDSALVEFKGHEVRFTDPRIYAVMAAPPHQQGIPTDNALAGTAFGEETGLGTDSELSLGVSIGYSLSVEGRGLVVGGSLTASVEASLDVTATKSTMITKAYNYTGTAESDKVVFASIPFDVYYYQILSSPREDEVGKKMVVNIPRPPTVLFVDRQFFNDNNGSFADIDSTVMSHTIGDPRTYPRGASVDKASLEKSGGFYSAQMTVGQGMGFQTATISKTVGTSVGIGFDLATKVETQAGADFDIGIAAGSVKGGPSFGFHLGFMYTVSCSQSAHYSGSVGNIINGDDWSNHQFNFGLYVQPITFEGQKFPVIQYWVD